ncbi:hypothetical protein, partial [Solihabitans fulvus]|uniref:hypothetical protein n=1 Tax=Solihabitans fulvus TaxID=1892852 RepID=UPI001CB76267
PALFKFRTYMDRFLNLFSYNSKTYHRTELKLWQKTKLLATHLHIEAQPSDPHRFPVNARLEQKKSFSIIFSQPTWWIP